SLPYAVAAELQFGKVGPAELEEAAWSSPPIARWLERIAVGIDPYMADEDEPAVTLVTKEGGRHTTIVAFPAGSPANPLPDDQLIAKFRDLAGTVMPKPQIEQIENAILRVEMIGDVRTLPDFLNRQ